MDLVEKERRYAWFRSQQRWHSRRVGEWHRSQERFYRKSAVKVFSFSEIVERTIRAYWPRLAQNIGDNNALMARLSTVR